MLFITRLNAKLPNDRDLLLPKQDSQETWRRSVEGEGEGGGTGIPTAHLAVKSSAVCAGDFLLRNTAAKLDGDLVIQYLPQYEIAVRRERDLFNRSMNGEGGGEVN